MNISGKIRFTGISMLLVAGMAACDKPGPAETAGQKMDQATESVGDKISDRTGKIGNKMGEQSARAGEAINDTEITAKVKAALLMESGLRSMQIGVDTVGGVVTLSGSVDTPTNSERAKDLAGDVAGVKSVDNRLALKSPS